MMSELATNSLIVIFVTALVLLFAWFVLRGLHKLNIKQGSGSSSIKLVGSKLIGHRQYVTVIQYRNKELILGVGQNQMVLLDSSDIELDDSPPNE
jgi:flagellar biogenesis protein FliO